MGVARWITVGAGRLALSHRPKLKAIPAIAAAGCRRIVTIQGPNETPGQIEQACREAGVAWTWVQVGHARLPAGEDDRRLRRAVRQVAGFLEAGETVLIHCSAGIHRTGMLAFAVLRWLGLAESEALGLIEAMRPVTREGMKEDHVTWGNRLSEEAGRVDLPDWPGAGSR
jgi:protein tyrosine phosphatase (PTP) superfamily phosphohydrolase (DUF442 family)